MKYADLKKAFDTVETIEELNEELEMLKDAQKKGTTFILIGKRSGGDVEKFSLRSKVVKDQVMLFAIEAVQAEIAGKLQFLESKGIEL